MESLLGKEAKDKITGFQGIIVSRVEYLFGCNQYGIAPPYDKEQMKLGETMYFDEGRIQVIGKGVSEEEVQVELPGADFNRDAPKRR